MTRHLLARYIDFGEKMTWHMLTRHLEIVNMMTWCYVVVTSCFFATPTCLGTLAILSRHTNVTTFFLSHPPSPPVFCSLIMCYWSSSKEMYPQLDVGPENFPSSYGIEPLPFLGAEGVVASSREVQRSFPLNDYGHLEFLLYSLATILLNGWKIRLRNYRTFNGRVSRAEFNRSICAFLKDDTSIKLESVGCESPISTLLHDMISNDPTGMFRHQVDLC